MTLNVEENLIQCYTWNIPRSITFSPLHFMLCRGKSITFGTVYSVYICQQWIWSPDLYIYIVIISIVDQDSIGFRCFENFKCYKIKKMIQEYLFVFWILVAKSRFRIIKNEESDLDERGWQMRGMVLGSRPQSELYVPDHMALKGGRVASSLWHIVSIKNKYAVLASIWNSTTW